MTVSFLIHRTSRICALYIKLLNSDCSGGRVACILIVFLQPTQLPLRPKRKNYRIDCDILMARSEAQPMGK